MAFDFTNLWQVVLFSGVSIYLGVLAAHITWGAWLQPWFDKRKYIVYTVDMSLKRDDETVDEFMARIKDEDLGKYEIIG